MKVVTIYWDSEKDVVTYAWSPEFETVYKVAKLDILQDAVADLTERYRKELDNE